MVYKDILGMYIFIVTINTIGERFMASLQTQKQEVFDYVYALLGGGMIDVELDPIHYETALGKALSRFRQRSIIV